MKYKALTRPQKALTPAWPQPFFIHQRTPDRWTHCSLCASSLTTVLLHPFSDLFFRTTWVSWYQKGKPFWILLQQETMGWHWHQLDHIHIICTSRQTDNHASTSPLSFYRPDALSQLPAAQPTASKHWRHSLTTVPLELYIFQKQYNCQSLDASFT